MRRWIIAFILLTPAAFPVSAVQERQERPPGILNRSFGGVRGRVLPSAGEERLPQDIQVTLTHKESREIKQSRSVTSTGHFEFDLLPPGPYGIKVTSPGYAPASQSVWISGSSYGERAVISIELGKHLAADGPLPPRAGPKTVSAEWLAIPKGAMEELRKADAQREAGNPEEAIKHLEKALEIYPDIPLVYTNLALQYLQLQKPDDALRCLEKAIESDPEDAIAHGNLGMIHLREGNLTEALRHLNKSWHLQPERLETLVLLGEYHTAMGDKLHALAFFRKAYEQNPRSPDLLLHMANCHFLLDRPEKALKLLEEFVRAAPDDGRVDNVKTTIARLRGQIH